jgi:hypothetical protein
MIAIARPRSALCDGRFAALAGQRKAAIRRLEIGMGLAVRMSMPFDEALLRAELVRRQDADDPTRAQHLTRAMALLEAQGARAELERIGCQTLMPHRSCSASVERQDAQATNARTQSPGLGRSA